MRIATLILPLACVGWACCKDLTESEQADPLDLVRNVVDKLVHNLVDAVLRVGLRQRTGLDEVTLAKPVNLPVPIFASVWAKSPLGRTQLELRPWSALTSVKPLQFSLGAASNSRTANKDREALKGFSNLPTFIVREELPAESNKQPPQIDPEDADSADVLGLNPALALDPEVEHGCTEYKRSLINPSPERFQQLVSQLKWRMSEGQGEALYEIGVDDDGTLLGLTDLDMRASYETLKKMAAELDADVSVACERQGKQGMIRTVLVRQRLVEQARHLEIRIAAVGNVDSGKSTLLGVLTKGVLDDGRGLARAKVFRFPHEAKTGRTSSVSEHILGFKADGNITNYGSQQLRETHSLRWSEIVSSSSKVLSFFDLAGHEKYLRTTLFGLTAVLPDYAMMVIDANRGGIVGMTREHLTIVLALKVPLFVVLTKVDMASEDLLQNTLDDAIALLKRPGVQKMPLIVRNEADVLTADRTIAGNSLTPIFLTSCVSGTSLDLVRLFLNHLPARRSWEKDASSLVQIKEAFQVPGIGAVVEGSIVSGTVTNSQKMLLGPDRAGDFKEVRVQSIQNKRVGVQRAEAGQTVSFAIKSRRDAVHKSDLRKGMVLVDKNLHPQATWQFQAEVLILVHPSTLKLGFSPVIHCLTVRQTARIISMSSQLLRSGDRATVTFQWLSFPEYIREGVRIVFRSDRTKGIGVVTKILPEEPKHITRDVALQRQQTPVKQDTQGRQKKDKPKSQRHITISKRLQKQMEQPNKKGRQKQKA